MAGLASVEPGQSGFSLPLLPLFSGRPPFLDVHGQQAVPSRGDGVLSVPSDPKFHAGSCPALLPSCDSNTQARPIGGKRGQGWVLTPSEVEADPMPSSRSLRQGAVSGGYEWVLCQGAVLGCSIRVLYQDSESGC